MGSAVAASIRFLREQLDLMETGDDIALGPAERQATG